jgi:hypothetical protein
VRHVHAGFLAGAVALTLALPVAIASAAVPPSATSTSMTATTIDVGSTVLLTKKTKTSGCKLGALSDRRCSPGAYSSKLTKTVICSPDFRTGPIRNVPDSVKHQVEIEYGLEPKQYGSTLEIDHIVSLELGGSNDPANLYPEEATFPDHSPGYHVKDLLENAVHKAVCAGKIGLRTAQRAISRNWELLYLKLLGIAPVG